VSRYKKILFGTAAWRTFVALLLLGLNYYALDTVWYIKDTRAKLAEEKALQEETGATLGAQTITGDNFTRDVIYRGSAREESYRYTHPTAGYSAEVPSQWLLGFIGTPYNKNLAMILQSPDYVKIDDPNNSKPRVPMSGAEIFIYSELPYNEMPSAEAEARYFESQGQTSAGPITEISIGGQPGIKYYRKPRENYPLFQIAVVHYNNKVYRMVYRSAILDESNPLANFERYQAEYERVLSTFVFPID
jgi:hypothetical protein